MTEPQRWLTPDEQAAWRAYLAMDQLVAEALDRQLHRDHGMPMTYYLILAMLSEAPGQELTLTWLARAVRSSPSRLSHALNRLEANDWVVRAPHPTDRRTTIARLTPAGRTVLEGAAPGHVNEVVRVIFSRLSAEQVTQLKTISDVIAEPLIPESLCPS